MLIVRGPRNVLGTAISGRFPTFSETDRLLRLRKTVQRGAGADRRLVAEARFRKEIVGTPAHDFADHP
jgi:hypothetical protein